MLERTRRSLSKSRSDKNTVIWKFPEVARNSLLYAIFSYRQWSPKLMRNQNSKRFEMRKLVEIRAFFSIMIQKSFVQIKRRCQIYQLWNIYSRSCSSPPSFDSKLHRTHSRKKRWAICPKLSSSVSSWEQMRLISQWPSYQKISLNSVRQISRGELKGERYLDSIPKKVRCRHTTSFFYRHGTWYFSTRWYCTLFWKNAIPCLTPSDSLRPRSTIVNKFNIAYDVSEQTPILSPDAGC